MKAMNFQLNSIEESAKKGIFSVEPLENGFGHTLGNSLRRVLLSSFKGAAITSVKVAGVSHKFSTLAGMSEDMIDLMLNLKSVKVAYAGDEVTTATLSVKGPKVVKASDINTPANVSIVSPDVVIANLAAGSKLDLELTIQSGYGYSPADERPTETLGVLVLDAIYSPVERVSYHVESTRVGRRTDFDKLVIEVITNGSLSPRQAVIDAASVLVAAFTQIVSPAPVSDGDVSGATSMLSAVSTDDLGLPTRVANALKNAGLNTAADLARATDKDLKNVKNLGEKSFGLIDEALSVKGLTRTK
ncbi:MAG: DNA-directed RNA polymerase subunit alpha [bacterium]|nr:DNA-directed RNA polymerase subunit alpha [Candidatus Microgenomates bacterium CPR3]MCQ3944596.1 DNA-directed RNA polymerase subunit alpha [bacterium]RIK51139.1 MAG: DNA-directed RNA polymerase subunit alpha [Candidatus Microgenomates bacterium]